MSLTASLTGRCSRLFSEPRDTSPRLLLVTRLPPQSRGFPPLIHSHSPPHAPRRDTPSFIESPSALPRHAISYFMYIHVLKNDVLHALPFRSRLPPSFTGGTPYPARPVHAIAHAHVLHTPRPRPSRSAACLLTTSLRFLPYRSISLPIPYVRPLCGLLFSCVSQSAQYERQILHFNPLVSALRGPASSPTQTPQHGC